ncbi:hypothetical protein [Simiduia agarivorans]
MCLDFAVLTTALQANMARYWLLVQLFRRSGGPLT